jgi:molybdopterin molybdotransferase
MRPSKYPLLSVDEAQAIIHSHTRVLPTERVWLNQALGRVLADTIVAEFNSPPSPISGVDGYAVSSTEGAQPRTVVGELTAGGEARIGLQAGEAARIMTGAPLPDGSDAVVMVEDTSETAGVVELTVSPRAGDNVRPRGVDLTVGQTVLEMGSRLGSAEIALLASVGVAEISVYRRPVVAVLATGDEVVPAWRTPELGQVRDSNQPALLAAIAEAGAIPVSLGIVRDDRGLQAERIQAGLEQADLVVSSGGVSVGSRDLIKPILESLGEIHVGRVAVKPGKPLTFATIGEKRFFGLPGFPVSTLVCFEVFVRPVLLAMQGLRVRTRPRVEVVLAESTRPAPDRTEYQRAIVRFDGQHFSATTTGVQVSSRLMSMVGANGLIIIEPGTEPMPAGSRVPALLTGPLA